MAASVLLFGSRFLASFPKTPRATTDRNGSGGVSEDRKHCCHSEKPSRLSPFTIWKSTLIIIIIVIIVKPNSKLSAPITSDTKSISRVLNYFQEISLLSKSSLKCENKYLDKLLWGGHCFLGQLCSVIWSSRTLQAEIYKQILDKDLLFSQLRLSETKCSC